MEWVEITVEGVIARMPTDVKSRYDAWLVSFPDKANRLAEITANTIREFRDNIKSVPKNYWHEDETYLPQSAVRHVDTIIVFTLAMEMGISIDTAGTAARYAADIFLRQILMGRYTTTTEEGGEGTPRYNAPTRDTAGRALPAFLAVMLAFVQFAAGGWIRPDSAIYDTEILTTFVPSDYSITSATLFGHLSGINNALASFSTNKASVLIYNGITNTASAGAFNLGDLPFISNSNCNWRILTSCEDIQYLYGTNLLLRMAYGETDIPRVKSITVITNPPTITLVFEAIGTSNRLETATASNNSVWSEWTDCTWQYDAGIGTVVATNIDLDVSTWARIVSLSGIVVTNPYIHITAPLYVGAETNASTRAVTYGELYALDQAKASKREVSSYTPLIHQLMTMGAPSISTNIETGIITTNWMTPGDLYPVWNFDKETGLVYFKDSSISNLTLGGETRTNWPQGTILGATINEPHTVETNEGVMAFTIGATGSGFPLTNDVSAAGFDLQGVGWFSAQNATISNNATVNNSFSVGGNAQIGGTLAVHDDMTVYGNLAVIGYSSNTQWHYLNVYTQVNGGTFTNFITENRYSTNNVYLVTNIVNTTYTTQFIDYVSVVGSGVDYSLSANVMLPHLTDGTETNAVATGTWDFSAATVIGLFSDADGESMRLDLTDGIHPRMTAVTNETGAAFIWPASSSWWRVYATSSITGVVPVVDGVELSEADILLLGVEVYRDSEVDFSWGGGDAALAGVTNEVPAGATSLHMLWRASGTTTWTGF